MNNDSNEPIEPSNEPTDQDGCSDAVTGCYLGVAVTFSPLFLLIIIFASGDSDGRDTFALLFFTVLIACISGIYGAFKAVSIGKKKKK